MDSGKQDVFTLIHPIDTRKIRALGMTFGGQELLVGTVGELIGAQRA